MEKLFDMSRFVSLRRKLHQNAETAGEEKVTNEILNEFIAGTHPDLQIKRIGGYGIAAVYDSGVTGKNIMFRADMDALPIEEINDFDYKSVTPGKGHKCGHDGHSTILCAIAEYLKDNRPSSGKVILLFQPAEETGEGADRVLNDPAFDQLGPDFVFGFHNLPGFTKANIIIKDGVFAAASRGFIFRLKGKTSHAAEPENGVNPAPALAEIISGTYNLVRENNFNNLTLLTIIHARLGEVAFGTSPGYAEYMATLRAIENEDIAKLNNLVSDICVNSAERYSLRYEEELTEVFPATVNNKKLVETVSAIARETGYTVENMQKPFKWSEDFGHFTSRYPGCYFGIGAGENVPQLHNPDYDFPEDLIPVARDLLINLIKYYTG